MSWGVIVIDEATAADVPAMTAILNAFMDTTTYEYTETPHEVDERTEWLAAKQAAGYPVVVARDEAGEVLGWASYGPFRDNERWPGYRFTLEHSVHVTESAWGRGIGRTLMDALCERARAAGMHVMIGAVDSTNVRSIEFHMRVGFTECARIREVGRKFDQWLDVVFLQRIL
jgi:phosphinothricin acetyltransferase